MPEIPDVTIYVEALRERLAGHRLVRASIRSPFLLRSTSPRAGKRIAIGFQGGVWLVLHLMIAGRLHWRPRAPKLAPNAHRSGVAASRFARNGLRRRRTSLARCRRHRSSGGGFRGVCRRPAIGQSHPEARAHRPALFSGIGNADSDEILHRARLSPIAMTRKLTSEETARLYQAVREVLLEWIGRLRAETGGKFRRR